MVNSDANRNVPPALPDLQAATLEMVLGWIGADWGPDSTANFARYLRWLLAELEPSAPAEAPHPGPL